MNILATARRTASFLALGLVALLVSGCMLTSETNLTSPDEAVQPLPAEFSMQTYNEGADGTFTTTEEAAAPFKLSGDAYVDPEGTMNVYFLPLGEDDGRYMLAITGSDGAIYGVARLQGDILELRVVFPTDPATSGVTLPAGATAADGGIMVTDRAALDAMIAMIDDGTLVTGPLLAWVGSGTPPATIVRDGDWYKAA